ncbi:Uncharacterised protein [Nocardia farcinica]|uniref:hypothetical protein n=1 Tax=Nocardia farcinica TaxID=37329 RepID=UPI000DFD63E8|nr:hypothetical protein [Nocardia farcinica]SUE29614.1 Uncharacterised protein [Nocardia farcinica]
MTSIYEWAGVIAGSGVVGGIVTALFDRKLTQANTNVAEAAAEKTEADEAEVLTRIAVSLVEPLEKRIAVLERENIKTNSTLTDAIHYIHELRCFIAVNVPDKTAPEPPASLGI